MKFPKVFWDAKPSAAPPIAETATITSGESPPARLRASSAPMRMRMRKVRTRLLAALGWSLARLAKRERYRVNILSRAMATTAIAIRLSMV